MLTGAQEEVIAEALRPLFHYLENEVIVDVARRIKESMAYTRTAELMAEEMKRLGFSPARIRKEAMKRLQADPDFRKTVAKNTLAHKREVKRKLREILKAAQHALGKVFKDAADLSQMDDLKLWKQGGEEIKKNSRLPQLVEGIRQQTAGELENLTRTTGFKSMNGFEAMENLYRKELDKAMIKVCTGAYTMEQAVYDTVHSLAVSGLRTVDFSSGYSMQLDTAVKLAVRTGAHQLAARIMDENIRSTGTNLVYVSRHWGARNKEEGHANHEKWQGKVYYVKDGTDYSVEAARIGQAQIGSLWEATGYSVDGAQENDPEGMHGYNCRHNHYPWFEGISELPDVSPEPEPVMLGGKACDYYAVTQKMRYRERAIRGLKREREALQALNMDTKALDAKIKRKIMEYKNFCNTCKVRPDINRLRYECKTSDLTKTEAWKRYQGLTVLESADVRAVGKIDKNLFEAMEKEMRTDEVILTKERMSHIRERRGEEFCKKYKDFFPDILKNPDYIFEDSRAHTFLVCKKAGEEEKYINLVLRIAVQTDDPKYKNSIITAIGESGNRFRQRLKNKMPLYSRE